MKKRKLAPLSGCIGLRFSLYIPKNEFSIRLLSQTLSPLISSAFVQEEIALLTSLRILMHAIKRT
jgi:hypothetical protein